MKTRLDQLTLRDLIELSCGDSTVLLDKGETPSEQVKLACARQILAEYKELASPNQAKKDMIEAEELTKLRMKDKCLRICLALCSQERPDMARDVLLELDVKPDLIDTDEKVQPRCKAMLADVEYEIKRIEELNEEDASKKVAKPEDARKTWYSEIAFVMSMLKMSIDPATVNAAIYANLVHAATERSRAMAKMPASMGLFM